MSFDADTLFGEIKKVKKELDILRSQSRQDFSGGGSSGGGGFGVGGTTVTTPSVHATFALHPTIHRLDEAETSPYALTGTITLRGASVIVEEGTNNASSTLEFHTINGTLNDGQILTMKPKEGKTLTLKTGGNIDITADVSVADTEFVILQYFDDNTLANSSPVTGTYSLLSGGGGDNLGDHTATQSLLMENFGIFFDSGQIHSIISGTNTLSYIVDDVISGKHQFFVDDLVTPKMSIQETTVDFKVDLNMGAFDINNLDRLLFDKSVGSSLTVSQTGITSDGAGNMNFNTTGTSAVYRFGMNADTTIRFQIGNTVNISQSLVPVDTSDTVGDELGVAGVAWWRAHIDNIVLGGALRGIGNIGELIFVNNTLSPSFANGFYSNGTDMFVRTNSTSFNLNLIGGENFTDAIFRVTDELDLTKKFAVDVGTSSSGVTTTLLFGSSANRTISFPNATTTLAGLNTTHTWTGVNTFDRNIVAGGSGDGMTNIGHLDFMDNASTPTATVSLYSDGLKLFSTSDLNMNNKMVTNTSLLGIVDTGGTSRGSISGDVSAGTQWSGSLFTMKDVTTNIATFSKSANNGIDFHANVSMNTNDITNMGGGTITGLSLVTVAVGDSVMISDVSNGGALKKVSANDFLGGTVEVFTWTNNHDASDFDLLQVDQITSGANNIHDWTISRDAVLGTDVEIGSLLWRSFDGGSVLSDYVSLIGTVESSSGGSEDGSLKIQLATAGNHNLSYMRFNDGSGAEIDVDQDMAFGANDLLTTGNIYNASDSSYDIGTNSARYQTMYSDSVVTPVVGEGALYGSQIVFGSSGTTIYADSADTINMNLGSNDFTFTTNQFQINNSNTILMVGSSNYFEQDERSVDPSAPTGRGRWYVKDVGGVSKPFFIGDGQSAVDLSSGGGAGVNSSYIWTNDETNEFDEKMYLSNAIMGSSGGLSGIDCRLYQNYIYYIPIYFSKACTINEIGFEMTGGGTGSIGFKYGLYSNRTDNQNYPYQLISGGSSTVYIGSSIGGNRGLTSSFSVPSAGLYWVAVNNTTNSSSFQVESGNSGGSVNTVGHIWDNSTTPSHFTPIQGYKESDSGNMPSTPDDDNEAIGFGNYSSGQTAPIIFLRVS